MIMIRIMYPESSFLNKMEQNMFRILYPIESDLNSTNIFFFF